MFQCRELIFAFKKNLVRWLILFELLILGSFTILQLIRPHTSLTLSALNFSVPENASYNLDNIYWTDSALTIEGNQTITLENTFSLPSGAYEITINYDSIKNVETPSLSLNDSTGNITCQLPNNPSAILFDPIKLTDNTHTSVGMFWIRSFANADNLKLLVNYTEGSLTIHSVEINEYSLYRFTKVLFLFFFFVVIDFAALFFIPNKILVLGTKTKYIILGILAISVFSSFPLFLDYLKTGHDIAFHLNRIVSLADSIKLGNIPQRIQPNLVNGYGYVTPLFYGEVFLLLPAVLYVFAVPLQLCYQIFFFVVNLATCWITFFCLNKITNDWQKSLVGSALYTLSSYRIMDLYLRSAVGEYLAITFFPLVLYGFFHVYTKKEKKPFRLKELLPIALGLTGIIQSHILSCEMVAIFIILFVLVFYKKTFSKNIFIALTKSLFLTIFLNLWFIVPFLQSMQQDLLVTSTDSINRIENTGVYLSQLFAVFPTFNGGNNVGVRGEMPLNIGFGFTIAIAVFLLYCIQRQNFKDNKNTFRQSLVLFILGGIALVLSLKLIPWDSIASLIPPIAKYIGIIQYAWRFIAIATVFLSFMATLLLVQIDKNISSLYAKYISVFLISSIIITEGFFFTFFMNDFSEAAFYSKSSLYTMDIGGGFEYLLSGTDLSKTSVNTVTADESIIVESFTKSGTHSTLSCTNNANETSYVDIPIFAYDNYVIRLMDGTTEPLQANENNCIRVAVPANYSGPIAISYQAPIIWSICNFVSLATLVIIIFCVAKDKKYYTQFGK